MAGRPSQQIRAKLRKTPQTRGLDTKLPSPQLDGTCQNEDIRVSRWTLRTSTEKHQPIAGLFHTTISLDAGADTSSSCRAKVMELSQRAQSRPGQSQHAVGQTTKTGKEVTTHNGPASCDVESGQ